MENTYSYSTEVEWTGERHGDLRAPVRPELQIDAPPEFKGHDGVWTPEYSVRRICKHLLHDYVSGHR